ncbi:TSUP family transporter [Reyranella sp.]|uniref:TSUP family transporter n=1 Tax=Reyranella sp. TaxID=1929291 RepID=UPI003BA8DEC1
MGRIPEKRLPPSIASLGQTADPDSVQANPAFSPREYAEDHRRPPNYTVTTRSPPRRRWLLGGAAGLLSGLTGVGGGVLVAPALIVFAWTSPRQAAALSPPFILGGALAARQTVAAELPVYTGAALVGAALGKMIGRRILSGRTTRFVLSGILRVAGLCAC